MTIVTRTTASLGLCAVAIMLYTTMLRSAGTSASVTIDSRATYLLTNQDPNAHDTVPIDLEALGLRPGDHIMLQAVGDFCFSIYQNCAASEIDRPMTAVFSSTSVLLASNVPNRVPDAVEAGDPVVTPSTLFGGIATDIPQDFFVAHAPYSTIVKIPADARYLFVAVIDSFYGDNDDPDADLAVVIARVPPQIAFTVRGEAVSGTTGTTVFMTGGGSFDAARHAIDAAGTFTCTPGAGGNACGAGESGRWQATDLVRGGPFKCTNSPSEPVKSALTGANTVVFLADVYAQGATQPAFTNRVIVSTDDIAPDIPGVQNLSIASIACGTATVHFSTAP